MDKTFNQRLESLSISNKSKLCIGLDIDPGKMPAHMDKSILGIESYLKEVIDSTTDICVAYKLNMAFYEQFGFKGYELMEKIVEYIDGKNITIADGKRGDIGNTTKKYAISIFDTIGFDSITVSPYMGEDSVRPFTERKDKWTVLLALTSNPGADDFEFHGNPPLFERVLTRSSQWGSTDNLMFVVGATRPELISRIRELVPESFLLVPGVGAQGGSLSEVAKVGLNSKCGLLVNSSRGILYASKNPSSCEEAVAASRREADKLALEMSKTLHL